MYIIISISLYVYYNALWIVTQNSTWSE